MAGTRDKLSSPSMSYTCIRRIAGTVTAFGTVVLLAACHTPSDAGCRAVSVAGTWSYTGRLAGAAAYDVVGDVVLEPRSDAALRGTFDLREFANGQFAGPYVGSITGCDASPDVELLFSAPRESRRHVAQRVADTIAGEWLQTDESGRRGTFRMVRRR
jgi:hypothetical protein